MYVRNEVNCFQFHNNLIIHKQINSIAMIQYNFLVNNWHWFFLLHYQTQYL